jgi:hypothetical protein
MSLLLSTDATGLLGACTSAPFFYLIVDICSFLGNDYVLNTGDDGNG